MNILNIPSWLVPVDGYPEASSTWPHAQLISWSTRSQGHRTKGPSGITNSTRSINTGTVISHFFISGASRLIIFYPRRVIGDWQSSSSHQPVNIVGQQFYVRRQEGDLSNDNPISWIPAPHSGRGSWIPRTFTNSLQRNCHDDSDCVLWFWSQSHSQTEGILAHNIHSVRSFSV